MPGVGPVDRDEIVNGYESGDEYVLLDPDEIYEIRLETKKTLELVQFVGSCEISPLWFDKPYYVVPTDDLAEKAYRVVRDALRKAEKTGLGQLTMRWREYLCAIRPRGDGRCTTPTRCARPTPELVAEVRYAELTADGIIRQGAYLGLR